MDFNPFKKKISELSSLDLKKGRVLVSEPFMQDPYFKRSVVFLTEHSKEGTVGFILNQPLGVKISELVPELSNCDFPVFLGGPVNSQNLFFLHKEDKLPGSIQLSADLYWDGDFEILKEWLNSGRVKADEIRFFLGYSGWDYVQLKDEINSQSWLITELKESVIFQVNTNSLWKESMKSMGEMQAIYANFPEDPKLN